MCEHYYRVDSAEQPDGAGRRKVVFGCVHCGEQLTKLTARTNKQIQQELDAQPTPPPEPAAP